MKQLSLLILVVCLGLSVAAGHLAAAVTLTTLHIFTGADGDAPVAALVQGTNGNFYGTTEFGGTETNDCVGSCGTVFEISPSGAFTSLHLFTYPDGSAPRGGLVQASDGNLYGTTFDGGACRLGTAFRITASGVLTTISPPDRGSCCAIGSNAGLVQTSDGDFYGTGGAGVFHITTNGVCTPLNVALPQSTAAGLIQGGDGNFYGTTEFGGTSTNCASGCGTVFQLTPDGVLTILHSFDGSDGREPVAGLVQGSDGNLYGTTSGGLFTPNCTAGCGTVFVVTTNGVFTMLHAFGGPEGRQPRAGLVQGSDGNFYGTTFYGGAFGVGTVFMLTTNGTVTRVISFGGTATAGADPAAALVQGSDGNFYGTTEAGGGITGLGTVFKLVISTNAAVTMSCVLSPALATNTVGAAHTVVATVTSNGTAQAGALVNFSVTGANLGHTGTATTSASGQGSFTYTGTAAGTDTIRAIAGGATGTATKVWVAAGGCPPITLAPATLPAGTVGVSYSQTITAAGGVPPSHFAVTAGALPSGLSLSSAGTLSGTPSAMGAAGFTVTATDANSCTGSNDYALTINAVPPVPHNFAVTSLTAPKKVTLKAGVTPKPGKVLVAIQNLGAQTEVIDAAKLPAFVTLQIESLGACATPTATLQPLKTSTVTLKPKQSLKLTWLVTINCANDPVAGAGHEDYKYTVSVDPSALDGNPDVVPANNTCPRPPNPAIGDKGCGNKDPATKQVGAPVLTDVFMK